MSGSLRVTSIKTTNQICFTDSWLVFLIQVFLSLILVFLDIFIFMITLSYSKTFTVDLQNLPVNTEAYSELSKISKKEFFVDKS